MVLFAFCQTHFRPDDVLDTSPLQIEIEATPRCI